MTSRPQLQKPAAIPVVILAGGQGLRMGGVDKCLLSLGKVTILEQLLTNFSRQSQHVFLNANGDPKRFSQYAVEVVEDDDPCEKPAAGSRRARDDKGRGPLAGLLASLVYLRERGCRSPWLVSSAGDCPFLPANLVACLHEMTDEETEVVYCHSAGHDHFVQALWSVSVEKKLAIFLQSQRSSVGEFIRSLRHKKIVFEAQDSDPFMNINTYTQLEQARALAGKFCHA